MSKFNYFSRTVNIVSVVLLYFAGNLAMAETLKMPIRADSNVKVWQKLTNTLSPKRTNGITTPTGTNSNINKDETGTAWTGSIPRVFYRASGRLSKKYDYLLSGHKFAVGVSATTLTTAFLGGAVHKKAQPMRGQLVKWNFLKTNEKAIKISGRSPSQMHVNSLSTGNFKTLIKKQPAVEQVYLQNLYSGIDMMVHSKTGMPGYVFFAEPGSDSDQIRFQVDGIDSLHLDKNGNLVAKTEIGAVIHSKPRAFELLSGKRKEIPAGFVLSKNNSVAIKVSGRNPQATLIIDPDITFVSYVGGSGSDTSRPQWTNQLGHFKVNLGLDVMEDGMVLLAGTVGSVDMLMEDPGEIKGISDIFAMRFNPDYIRIQPNERIQYLTFLQGPGRDIGTGIVAAPDGKAYVTGYSDSLRQSPTSTGIYNQPGSFVMRLDQDGILETSKVIGENQEFYISDLVYEPGSNDRLSPSSELTNESNSGGALYIAGTAMQIGGTREAETTNSAFQKKFRGGIHDGFVAKLDADLTEYKYLTMLGGNSRDVVFGLAVDQGRAFVTGATMSDNFPVSDFAYQSEFGASDARLQACEAGQNYCFDSFVTGLSPDGDELIFSTYYGADESEYGNDIAFSAGQILAVSGTRLITVLTNPSRAFIAHFSTDGQLLNEEVFTGGLASVEAVTFDSAGKTYIAGSTSTPGRESNRANGHQGGVDLFYGIYDQNLANVELFHYVGGDRWEYGLAVAGIGDNETGVCLISAGITTSPNIQTVGALPEGENLGGAEDILLAGWCSGDIGGLPPPLPNDALTKSGPAEVWPNDTGTYTITLRNSDGNLTENITIIDPLPDEFRAIDVRGPNCIINQARNRTECSFDAIQSDIILYIDFEVRDSACQRGRRPVSNIAQLDSGNTRFSSNETTTTILCSVACLPGEITDGIGGCCADQNFNGQCDNICPAGQTDYGNGQCCPDVNGDAQCDLRCDPELPSSLSTPDNFCTENEVCGRSCVHLCSGIEIAGMCFFGDMEKTCTSYQCATPNLVDEIHPDHQ